MSLSSLILQNFIMKKILVGAFALVSLMATALPALAQTTLLGDTKQTGSSFALSTAAFDELPQSGLDALWIDDLEIALALPSTSLGFDAYEGSAIAQTVTVSAGTLASFDWILKTNAFDVAYVDRAFVVINGSVMNFANVAAGSVSGSFSHLFDTAGTYGFAVGVVDVNDVAGVSFLDVSNLTFQVSAVPEPTSVILLLAGLAGVGAVARKRRA